MKQYSPFTQLLHTSSVTVDLRWFYGTIAFLFAMISTPAAISPSEHNATFILLIVYLLVNFIVFLLLADISSHKRTPPFLTALNVAQVVLDFVYITILIFLVGTPFFVVGYLLYFIPIILALLFFSFSTTVLLALCTSAIIFFLRVHVFVWIQPSGGGLIDGAHISPVIEVGVVAVMYLVTAFFGGSVIRSIRTREQLLTERIHKEEEHLKELNILAREFDRSAKLLVRRDLDLMKAHRDLERIDQMKSEIISVVAHQLRTPLSAVKWTLRMLTDGDAGTVTTEQKTMMLKAYESNERMISLVNDILSADRMESGKFRYRFFPIQLEDLIENVVTEILSKAINHGVSVRFLRPARSLPRVTIDPDKIREVLQNLIDNAIKYSRRGGTVTIGLQEESQSILCSIADQGIGIPKIEKEKIFGRFFRAQNALRVETDGSGLGLFIVRGIIQRHGGDVSFDSEEGKGTTMRFRLPLDPLSRMT